MGWGGEGGGEGEGGGMTVGEYGEGAGRTGAVAAPPSPAAIWMAAWRTVSVRLMLMSCASPSPGPRVRPTAAPFGFRTDP